MASDREEIANLYSAHSATNLDLSSLEDFRETILRVTTFCFSRLRTQRQVILTQDWESMNL